MYTCVRDGTRAGVRYVSVPSEAIGRPDMICITNLLKKHNFIESASKIRIKGSLGEDPEVHKGYKTTFEWTI